MSENNNIIAWSVNGRRNKRKDGTLRMLKGRLVEGETRRWFYRVLLAPVMNSQWWESMSSSLHARMSYVHINAVTHSKVQMEMSASITVFCPWGCSDSFKCSNGSVSINSCLAKLFKWRCLYQFCYFLFFSCLWRRRLQREYRCTR